ncbi:MAG: hypothetical protein CL681_02140 [Blastopirellula sp.]|nr:hypothetical protein [Blastopirellula sp.]
MLKSIWQAAVVVDTVMDELALMVAQLQIDSSLVVQPQACGLLTGFSRLASMRCSGLKVLFALLEFDWKERGGGE